jgi:TonB family protein
VRLDIDTEGVVRKVKLDPSTGDRRYDAKLRKVAMNWRFHPARDPANQPVAVEYDVQVTL